MVLECTVLYCSVLFCTVLVLELSWSWNVMFCTVLYCSVLFWSWNPGRKSARLLRRPHLLLQEHYVCTPSSCECSGAFDYGYVCMYVKGWLAGWGAGWLAEAQRGPERPRKAERG